MLKPLFTIFIIILSSISMSYAQCPFDSSSSNCEIYFSGDNNITIKGIEDNDVYEIKTKLFLNSTSTYHITKREENTNNFLLESPLLHSGEYEVSTKGYDAYNQQIFNTQNTFFLDLYQPNKPLIQPLLESSIVTVTKEQEEDTILAYDINKNDITPESDVKNSQVDLHFYLQKPTYIEFKARSNNNILSESTRRYVYPNKIPNYIFEEVTSIILDKDAINKANNVYNSITNKRNFFVSGSANAKDGTIIYINGQKVPIISNVFGAFIELNTGENLIEVRSVSGALKDTYKIKYDNSKFFFQNLEAQKVFQNNFRISGKTSLNHEFLLFVNGNYIDNIKPNIEDNSFSFEGNSPNRDKVFVELYGRDNSYESFVLYKDSQAPKVISKNLNSISNSSSLLFLIQDDVGINYSSIKLELNQNSNNKKTLSPKSFFGSYVVFDTKNLLSGEYTYELSGSDLSQRDVLGDTNGKFNVSEKEFYISSYNNNNLIIYGNNFFTKDNIVSFNLNTNEAISFKHILVDGKDHTNYEILSSSKVEISDLELNSNKGVISFIYVDKDNQEFTRNYTYILDELEIELNLDAITQFSRGNSNLPEAFVRITGSINHPLFDWSTFYINGNTPPFFTSNNNFEAYVNVVDGNILFSGETITRNSFNTPQTQDLFYLDNKEPSLNTQVQNNEIIGSIANSNKGYEELLSFENTKFSRTYLSDQFQFSPEQRPGLQIFEIKARNQFSHEEYISTTHNIVDFTKPQVFYNTIENNTYIQIDGTHSEIISTKLIDSLGEVISTSSCTPHFYRGSCIFLSNFDALSRIEINDSKGNFNNIAKENIGELQKITDFTKVYFHGTNTKINQKESFVQGTIINNKKISRITTNKRDICEFDGVNFICPIFASIGENNISLVIYYQDSSIQNSKDSIIIKRIGNNPLNFDVSLDSGVFGFGDRYYFFEDPIKTSIKLSDSAQISYYINGQKVVSNNIGVEGENVIEIDLNSYIQNKDNVKLDLLFKAENDDIKETSIFTLVYDSTKKLLMDIFIS